MADILWDIWSADTTSTATSSVWGQWTATYGTDQWKRWVYDEVQVQDRTTRWVDLSGGRPTPAEVEAARLAARKADRLRREAKQRARELLYQNLTPEQIEMLRRTNRFHVVCANGDRYEINPDKHHGSIEKLDDQGRPVENLCVYSAADVPLADNALAMKLALETDPAQLRRVANIMQINNVRRGTG